MSAFKQRDLDPIENLKWNQSVMKIVHRGLAVVMICCLTFPLIMLVQRIFPEWQGGYVIPVVFFVSIEAFYSHHRMRKVNIIEPSWWYSRIAELIVILVLLKALLYAINGFDQFLIDLPLWRENFYNVFFTREYLLMVLLIIPIWFGCAEIDNLFNQIEADEQLIDAEIDSGFSEERIEVRRTLANLIIVIGGLMVSLVAVLNFDSNAVVLSPTSLPVGLTAVLGYFVCGLILLSLTQLAILRTRWVINRIKIDRSITTRWIGFSLILIFGLGLIVILLPTGYSGQLLMGIQVVLGIFIVFFQFLLYFLSLPFILIFSLIMSLFNRPVKEIPQPPPIKQAPLLPQTPNQPVPWFELVKSILFWVVLLGLIGYAFYFYLHEHPEYFRWLFRSHLWSRIAAIWRKTANWFLGANRQIAEVVSAGLNRIRPKASAAPGGSYLRTFNPRRLSPRQQVIFYYLSLVRRAGETGLIRDASQTPLEFAEQLKERLLTDSGAALRDIDQYYPPPEPLLASPEAGEIEVSQITERFMEARYSQHPITSDQAGIIRSYWKRILKIIRKAHE